MLIKGVEDLIFMLVYLSLHFEMNTNIEEITNAFYFHINTVANISVYLEWG